MNKWSKKMVAGTMAAAVLIGGAAIALNQPAYAATTGTDTSTTAPTATAPTGKMDGRGMKGGKFGFCNGFGLVQEAATIIGIDEATLRTELQTKTLAQVAQEKANLTEDVLLQKLVEAGTKVIDEAVTAGKLTQEQADQQKAALSEKLTTQITSVQPADGDHGGRGGKGGKGFGGVFGSNAEIAALLGITEDELKTELQSGKSLSEVAEAHGVTREDLITKIKSGLDAKIGEIVDRKHTKQAPAGTAAPSTSNQATGA